MQNVRPEYPRPQFRRDMWLSLNGEWEFDFDDNNDGVLRGLHKGNVSLTKKINVPFTYQYPDSGIGDITMHNVVWYKKSFIYKEENKNIVMGFNGSDYITDLWVNGHHAITHQGGFAPFTVDITKYLVVGENKLVVRCYDPYDPTIPRGKQSWLSEPFGCWYIPNTGIWQSVWLDYVGEDYIDNYSITPNIDNNSFYGEIKTAYGNADTVEVKVYFKDKLIKRQVFSIDGIYTRYTVNLMEINYIDESTFWEPHHPNLHYVDFTLYKDGMVVDTVHTRFGMRKISVSKDGRVLINNKPLYQRLVLDQGYWPNSGLTPPSVDAIRHDIEVAKAMGFNGARKHQKFEDPYFYYLADEIGFLTWCEMPSAYNFNSDEIYYQTTEWQQIVNTARNFSSVITYVPINESWGVRKAFSDPSQQNYLKALYYLTKAIDGSRLISTNDGWESPSETDILGIHDYAFDSFKFKEIYNKENYTHGYQTFRKIFGEGNLYKGQPVLLTEFGGMALESSKAEGAWGYNSAAKNNEEFYERLSNLMEGIFDTEFQGYCYTQLTDVQQEVNGLLDPFHNLKFDVKRLNKIFKRDNEF